MNADDFNGYAEPIGTVVTLYPCETPRTRLARLFFQQELFVYMSELASGGQSGWGYSFNSWLAMGGWKLVAFATYERVEASGIDSGTSTEIRDGLISMGIEIRKALN